MCAPDRCSVGGPQSSIASATPVPSAQSVAGRASASRRPSASAASTQIHALVEAITAEPDIGGVVPHRLDPVARADHVQPPDREGSMPELLAELVDGAFDGEGRLRRAIAAEPAGRHHIGVDRVARRPSCWGSDRRPSGCRATPRAFHRRGRHRRRCWTRRGSRCAVSVPSRLRAKLDRVVIGWRVLAPMNCSSRVNSHFTGRPVSAWQARRDPRRASPACRRNRRPPVR